MIRDGSAAVIASITSGHGPEAASTGNGWAHDAPGPKVLDGRGTFRPSHLLQSAPHPPASLKYGRGTARPHQPEAAAQAAQGRKTVMIHRSTLTGDRSVLSGIGSALTHFSSRLTDECSTTTDGCPAATKRGSSATEMPSNATQNRSSLTENQSNSTDFRSNLAPSRSRFGHSSSRLNGNFRFSGSFFATSPTAKGLFGSNRAHFKAGESIHFVQIGLFWREAALHTPPRPQNPGF